MHRYGHLIQTFLFLIVLTNMSYGQTKKLDHSDFAIWKTNSSVTISNNGEWVSYVEKPGEGDPTLKVYEVKSGKTLSFERSTNPTFTPDGKFISYKVSPADDTLKMLRRKKTDKKDLPGDTLAILQLEKRKVHKFGGLKKNWTPEEINGYIIYQAIPPKIEPDTSVTEKAKKNKKEKLYTDKNGFPLVIRNLKSGLEDTIDFVTEVKIAKSGPYLTCHSTGKDSTFTAGIYHYQFANKKLTPIAIEKGKYKKLAISEDGKKVAFLSDVDTTKIEIRPFQIRYFEMGFDSAKILNTVSNFIPSDWNVSENATPYFSKNGDRLFFGIAPEPILQDTNLLKEEIVNVEVWNYQDGLLYTHQNVLAEDENKKSYLVSYAPDQNKFIQIEQLSNDNHSHDPDNLSPFVITYNSKPYEQELSWVGNSARDIYLVDLRTGNERLIGKSIHGYPQLSPNFKFVYWYNQIDTTYYTYNIDDQKIRAISTPIKHLIYDELNDRPTEPSSYRTMGWINDDEAILVNDRYDIWQLDPYGKKEAKRWTKGREKNIVHRYIRTDRDERFIDQNKMVLLSIFDETDKSSGYASYEKGSVTTLLKDGYKFNRRPDKSKDANLIVFTKEDFKTFPDFQITSDYFKTSKKISDTNPQQKEFAWGSIKIVTWTSTDGQQLEGLLAMPADFDPSKKYPMLVNFYERSSNNLHSHRTPAPGRSTINYSFYTSRGYLIFNPDVPYKIGYPGESAYNAVVSGTKALIEKGFVDEAKIGLQGHSWGGYQVAHIITKTDMFACVESGAPVVNMISAYGGIRWGSGMSRMFQYERTQSRIGGTLWEKPELYIENSPIFNADKINTPVLILHNDNDGAVPWYQGIEFFTAMRRLGKPAWMLNYMGEPHWPLKLQNRKDFNIRMQQFFDHYLMNQPMPVWMEKGIPAIHKSILQGYEMGTGRMER